jgi:hypothetical protein
MPEIHNLGDYSFAKEMVTEIPAAIQDLEQCMNILYKHRNFDAVCNAIFLMDDAIIKLATRLPYFQRIVDNKGEL